MLYLDIEPRDSIINTAFGDLEDMDEENLNHHTGEDAAVTGAVAGTDENERARLQKERDEYLDGWKRAKADLANYKKDEAKRFEMLSRFANESLLRELIRVLDSFDLAFVSLGIEQDQKQGKGLLLIRQQLEDIARGQGLERIAVEVGSPFDPATQEAIATEESDKPSGAVIEEVERGYALHGKVVRPARVRVAK